MYRLEDFYYDLPEELIAQKPVPERDESRLMVVDPSKGTFEHRIFKDIKEYLKEGDCLVLNDTRVIPARLFGKREKSGGALELVLLKDLGNDTWEVLAGPGKKALPGNILVFGDNEELKAEVLKITEGGNRIVKFYYKGIFNELLDRLGAVPLPPYIKEKIDDAERYQTVYSRIRGSAAAPTAGLHFTDELLESIREKGVETAFVTLHVGLGTFRPVKTENIEDHVMHSEYYSVSHEAAAKISYARRRGGRIIAVGTTSLRVLETAAAVAAADAGADAGAVAEADAREAAGAVAEADAREAAGAAAGEAAMTADRPAAGSHAKPTENQAENREGDAVPHPNGVLADDGDGFIRECSGWTDIFIYPGYNFKAVDLLITNFHLPCSTLFMLVSAFSGRELTLKAYNEAIRLKYRFFSFGDAMLLMRSREI